MRAEPRIDAMGVESVVTVWKDTAFVAVFELRQADGAIFEPAVGVGGVSERGKEGENGRVKAIVANGGGISPNTVAATAATEARGAAGVKENEKEYR